MDEAPGIGGMPKAKGVAARLETWLAMHQDMPGAPFLSELVKFAVKKFKFEPDAFVHELVDSIIGDNYPVPDRMLVHNERITHEYLMWAMCGDPKPAGKFDLYAVEGGTAAMCYIFKTLKANRLLHLRWVELAAHGVAPAQVEPVGLHVFSGMRAAASDLIGREPHVHCTYEPAIYVVFQGERILA